MSAHEEITVLARWELKTGARDEVLAIVAELRPKSLAEPGCLSYEAYQLLDAPDTLLLVERYRDADAIEAHKRSEHYQQLVTGRVLPLLMDRSVELLQQLNPA
jgi:quinol monooxygenase YgiN